MAAPSASGSAPPQNEFEVPEGWIAVTKRNENGELVKYYTNILGQRFYSESDLMRNIKYAKERGLTIYAPDFEPPTTGPFAMPSREVASTSNKNVSKNNSKRGRLTSENKGGKKSKNEKDVERHQDAEEASAPLDDGLDEDEVQCAMALLELSGQRNVERRASRRLAGRQPELQVDVDFNRALEYIIKDKHQQ